MKIEKTVDGQNITIIFHEDKTPPSVSSGYSGECIMREWAKAHKAPPVINVWIKNYSDKTEVEVEEQRKNTDTEEK